MSKKALDERDAAALNERLAAIWPALRDECRAFMLPVPTMHDTLERAGGATTGAALGLDSAFYRDAVIHSREMRNRYSVLDLLGDAGELPSLAANER